MRHLVYIIFLSLFIVSCSSSIRFASNRQVRSSSQSTEIGNKYTGVASYYADKFNGRLTASGEVFNNDKLTAAHRSLPFQTMVKVTNLSNGKFCFVKINDRGPFVDNRIIDLSKEAAKQLDMIKTGIAEVEIEILE